MNEPAQAKPLSLKKTMGLFALTLYGLGNMLGAGIYGTIGKAAGEMGNAVWMAFLMSMVAAGLTGLSYASIGSRYPRAGGAAYITQRAFNLPMLAYVVGLVVMASGLTSMATTANTFSIYFFDVIGLKEPTVWHLWMVIISLIGSLAFINFWGLREAVWLNALCTLVETGGLVLIIAVGLRYWGGVNYLDATTASNPTGDFSAQLILMGAVLTFYSFIGFEDMLNVSEEVKNPQKTFPLAMILALILASLIYMAVSITAVSVVPSAELATSSAGPLTLVIQKAAPWFNDRIFAVVALFAVTNTALLNYIMGSRLAYGMSRQGLLPAFIGKLHPARRTPHVAIVILALIVLAMALVGDLKKLASATSILLLLSFCVVNASLIVLKRRPDEPRGGFNVPVFVPLGGILISLAMVGSSIWGTIKEIRKAFDARSIAEAGSTLAGMSDWAIFRAHGIHLILVVVIIAVVCMLYAVLKPRQVLVDEAKLEEEFAENQP